MEFVSSEEEAEKYVAVRRRRSIPTVDITLSLRREIFTPLSWHVELPAASSTHGALWKNGCVDVVACTSDEVLSKRRMRSKAVREAISAISCATTVSGPVSEHWVVTKELLSVGEKGVHDTPISVEFESFFKRSTSSWYGRMVVGSENAKDNGPRDDIFNFVLQSAPV